MKLRKLPFAALRLRVILLPVIYFFSFSLVNGQNGAECYKPLSGLGKTATPVQSGVLCGGCTFVTGAGNITNADKNDYATFNTVLGLQAGNGVSVADSVNTYPAGWHAGYVVDLGNDVLSATVLGTFTIETYNNGTLQESKNTATGLSASLLSGTSGKVYLNFKTTQAFDEVRFIFSSVAGAITTFRIYYAMAFDPSCGISYTSSTCYKQLAGPATSVNFNGGLLNALVTLSNGANINDGDKTTAGTLTVPVATPILSEPVYVSVTDREAIYPAGNKAGFVIGYSSSLLTASVLNSMSLETRLHGVLQESINLGSGSGVSLNALSAGGSGQKEVSFTTTKAFNEIRLVTDNTLGVNIGAVDVYYAFSSGAACTDCRQVLTSSQSAPYTGAIQASRTGTFGTVCIGQSMSGTANVTDASLTNFATYTPAILSVGCGGRISVTNGGGSAYPANTFAGFAISRQSTLLDLNILNAITVNVYNSGTLVQSSSGSGLVGAGLLNPVSGVTNIGFKPTVPFNEIQIVFDAGLISASLGGTYNIYYAYVIRDDDGDGVPDCVEVCGTTQNDAVDTDGDGVPNACDACNSLTAKSSLADTDGDGIANSCDLDSDNDGISDANEDRNADGDYSNDDTDGDGVPDYLDLDSDNDGIPDLYESGISVAQVAALDANNDGVIDAGISKGTNGLADVLENVDNSSAVTTYTLANKDGDSVLDFNDLDSDNDGINDIKESGRAGLADANNDGIVDFPDTDRDGIMDSGDGNAARGATAVAYKDTDGDAVPDSRDLDSDNDGINDIRESGLPASADADGNGMVDGTDPDGDGIVGVADGSTSFGDGNDAALPDNDGDNVPNYRDLDSDNDSISDLVEGGSHGTDADQDGVADGPDTDGDGIVNSVDGAPAVYGDNADGVATNTDGDALPDYLDPDSNNDGTFDIAAHGWGSADGNNDGRVDNITDPDGDGIMNILSGLDNKPGAFGGLGQFVFPLPVALVDFTAYKINNSLIRLSWQTGAEEDLDHFITEHSADGSNFATFGTMVKSSGNKTGSNYNADDAAPFTGSNYYRLRMVEKNGTVSLSKTVRVLTGISSGGAVLMPTVAERGAELMLYFPGSTQTGDRISLVSAGGVLVRQINTGNAASVHISTADLAPGVYWIMLSGSYAGSAPLQFIVR